MLLCELDVGGGVALWRTERSGGDLRASRIICVRDRHEQLTHVDTKSPIVTILKSKILFLSSVAAGAELANPILGLSRLLAPHIRGEVAQGHLG